MSYTVGQVAALTHVTVRALHHYDEIGLLTPSERTEAGYRRYVAADLERLRQLLVYRELGFPLDQIAALLNGDADPQEHLRTQRQLLGERITRLQAMVAAIDQELEATRMGITLKPEERFEVFGNFVPEDHHAEAEERWGTSPAFAESQRRVARYTKDDWLRVKNEAGDRWPVDGGDACWFTGGQCPGHGSCGSPSSAHHPLVLRVQLHDSLRAR